MKSSLDDQLIRFLSALAMETEDAELRALMINQITELKRLNTRAYELRLRRKALKAGKPETTENQPEQPEMTEDALRLVGLN